MPDVTCGLIQLIREWFNKQEARVTHDPNIQVFNRLCLPNKGPYTRLPADFTWFTLGEIFQNGNTPFGTFDSHQFIFLSQSIIFNGYHIQQGLALSNYFFEFQRLSKFNRWPSERS